MADNLKARDGNRLYKAQLLSYYYSRRAESAIGKGARFVISKAYWCKSSLVTANGAGGWNIADIPLDFKLSGAQQFAVSDLILSSVDGIITINAAFLKKECRITRLTTLTRLCLLMLRNRLLVCFAPSKIPSIKVNVTVFS